MDCLNRFVEAWEFLPLIIKLVLGAIIGVVAFLTFLVITRHFNPVTKKAREAQSATSLARGRLQTTIAKDREEVKTKKPPQSEEIKV